MTCKTWSNSLGALSVCVLCPRNAWFSPVPWKEATPDGREFGPRYSKWSCRASPGPWCKAPIKRQSCLQKFRLGIETLMCCLAVTECSLWYVKEIKSEYVQVNQLDRLKLHFSGYCGIPQALHQCLYCFKCLLLPLAAVARLLFRCFTLRWHLGQVMVRLTIWLQILSQKHWQNIVNVLYVQPSLTTL